MAVYRKLSIKRKMFLMIILIMSFIITLAFSSLYYTYSIYDGQLYDKSYRLLNLSSTTVDMELKKLEAMSLAIISDAQIQRGLKDLMQDDAEYVGYITRKKMTDQLWAHISTSERYVQSVHIIDSKQRVSKYGESPSFSEDKYERMMMQAVDGKGEVRWLYPDASDSMLIMVREVRAYEPLTLEPIGILFLRINVERLVEDYAGIASQKSDIILKSGEAVVYPYAQIPDGVSQALQPLEARDGYEIKQLNGETTFLSQKKSAYTGWMYYNVIPYNHIFEKIVWLKNVLIIVYCFAILIVVAMGMAFARSLTRPIRQLISQMKEVQYGDLDSMDASMSAPVFQQMDEVGLLQRTYRMMITRINTLIKENYANQLVIKETEFKALQAQINPHFLYNALDSIHWLAKKNAQEQISSMVVSLGYLLRSSISLKQNVITVAEELETVKHYITIQKYRFQNRLDFHMDVPRACYNAPIPKLTLQPLLENAVQYGLEPMIEPCTIRLYAREVEGKLALIVEDGGPGMEEADVQRVLSGEAKTRGTGIGLLNIKHRIKLAFGEGYGIRMESKAGGGMKVIVLIPPPQGEEA
ncbi:two-component system, sensor histidine kinase YesM [Paenibacillus algorifonticola]|uniref:histidine kinase n=1 Tax=Paenibacillus algorifonticola TaxID=684063 RepID=A0A1I2HPZ6_9BACL|nr:sensor histidine kinase [Paenibacillus algorifonticola]SFF31618.1 two-component system, sensor histidine kinase YesM [Paenibacillus algorifonticola]